MTENIIYKKSYADLPEIRDREIWRYAGYKGIPGEDERKLLDTLEQVKEELKGRFTYRVCYRRLPLLWLEGEPQLPFESHSRALAECLKNSNEIVFFAASIGPMCDRMIARYEKQSPIKALLLQAYGAERIETLCDHFSGEVREEAAFFCQEISPRFSPGYGDFPLEHQRDFFRLLDCSRQIGVSLGESLLMSPSKSVTAVFGIRPASGLKSGHKCGDCGKSDCEYRQEYM